MPRAPRSATPQRSTARTSRVRRADTRPSAFERGYGAEWRRIRAEVLRAHGIPQSEWPRYDVHHTPEYNPDVEPDHRRYQLTPLLHEDHSRVTGKSKRKRRCGKSAVFYQSGDMRPSAEVSHIPFQVFAKGAFDG